jgi:hypothetical protein
MAPPNIQGCSKEPNQAMSATLPKLSYNAIVCPTDLFQKPTAETRYRVLYDWSQRVYHMSPRDYYTSQETTTRLQLESKRPNLE